MTKLSIIVSLLVAGVAAPAFAAPAAAPQKGLSAVSDKATCGRPANPGVACDAAKPAQRAAAARLSEAETEKRGQRQLDQLIASIQ